MLADVQVNLGGGATSANTDLLNALVEAKCQRVLMGLFHDPELVEHAHNLGLNATFSSAICPSFLDLQKSDVQYEIEVIALSDGKVKYNWPCMAVASLRWGKLVRCGSDIRLEISILL